MSLRTRPLLGLGLLAAILALGYGIWWWRAASVLETRIQAWIDAGKADGGSVEIGTLKIDGFPLWLRAKAATVAVRRPDGTAWQGAEVVAQARPWRVTDIDVGLPGDHQAQVPMAGGAPLALRFHDGFGHLVLTLTGTPTDARLTVSDAAIGPAHPPDTTANGTTPHDTGLFLSAGTLDLAASQPAVPPADHQAAGLSVSLTARSVTLPAAAETGLGRDIETLALAARVMGPPPLLHRPALASWSQAGGAVELDRLDLAWGALSAGINGTLALDNELQPEGALTAEVRGAFKVVDALVAAGRIRAKDAGLVKTALGMFGGSRPGAAPDTASFPVSIQRRALWLGPVKLMPMPPVQWP